MIKLLICILVGAVIGFSLFGYVMIYQKETAPKEVKRLQRWCNNRFIFRSVEKFEDYKG